MANDAQFLIAERYSQALFSLAVEQGAEEAVAADLTALDAAYAESAELRYVASSPQLSRQQKAKALSAVLAKGKAHALTQQFIARLSLNNRLSVLTWIIAAYLRRLAEHKGEAAVQVTTALPLSKDDEKKLAAALEKSLSKKVRMDVVQDASLIGGLRLHMGSRMLDYSVKGRLERLGLTLKQAVQAA